MQAFTETITGIDGTEAALQAYVIDNNEEIDEARVRPAVLILPGGAYAHTSAREAEPVAIRMISYGYQAFVLHYSCPPSYYPTSTLQVAEAMRRIREHADEWHVDPDAIVVMGFSAGGHAAALFAESWNTPLMDEHGFDREQVRPNGLALSYPVITAGEHSHHRSIENLLGPDRAFDPAWNEKMSLERHVSADVPQTFLWTTATDRTVPVQNSLMFVAALVEAGVNVEAHVFPTGEHGAGLANGESAHQDDNVVPCAQVWPSLFDTWLAAKFPKATTWRC